MIKLKAEKQRIARNLQTEIAKIARALENDLQIARTREASLSRGCQERKAELAQANEAEVGLNTLERDAEANRCSSTNS